MGIGDLYNPELDDFESDMMGYPSSLSAHAQRSLELGAAAVPSVAMWVGLKPIKPISASDAGLLHLREDPDAGFIAAPGPATLVVSGTDVSIEIAPAVMMRPPYYLALDPAECVSVREVMIGNQSLLACPGEMAPMRLASELAERGGLIPLGGPAWTPGMRAKVVLRSLVLHTIELRLTIFGREALETPALSFEKPKLHSLREAVKGELARRTEALRAWSSNGSERGFTSWKPRSAVCWLMWIGSGV